MLLNKDIHWKIILHCTGVKPSMNHVNPVHISEQAEKARVDFLLQIALLSFLQAKLDYVRRTDSLALRR